VNLLIGFLPGVGSLVRQASLCFTHHSTLDSVCFLALSPFPFLPGSKSLSISPSLLPVRPSSALPHVRLLPFDYFLGHLRILRTSWLPQVLYLLRLATLVSAWRTHTHAHICSCSTFRNRQARCDSRNGRLLPSSSKATPLGGCIVCMCSTAAVAVAAPTRETPTVGIVYRGIQRPYCFALSPPLLDKPLLIYLLNNTTAAVSLASPSSPPWSLSSLNRLLRVPSLSMPSGRYCFTGSVESCGLRCLIQEGGIPREARGCKLKRLDWDASTRTL